MNIHLFTSLQFSCSQVISETGGRWREGGWYQAGSAPYDGITTLSIIQNWKFTIQLFQFTGVWTLLVRIKSFYFSLGWMLVSSSCCCTFMSCRGKANYSGAIYKKFCLQPRLSSRSAGNVISFEGLRLSLPQLLCQKLWWRFYCILSCRDRRVRRSLLGLSSLWRRYKLIW